MITFEKKDVDPWDPYYEPDFSKHMTSIEGKIQRIEAISAKNAKNTKFALSRNNIIITLSMMSRGIPIDFPTSVFGAC